MVYAQLDFTENTIKRVMLIGGAEVGIVPQIIERKPECFIVLDERENKPENDIEWYYNSATDTFIHFTELPETEATEPEAQPLTEAEQMQIETYLNTAFIADMMALNM